MGAWGADDSDRLKASIEHRLRAERLSERDLLLYIHERISKMPTIDDLNAAVDKISTAVNDAANAIKDEAQKLANASSVNPADVENAANRLSALADQLTSAVSAAGEPVTQPSSADSSGSGAAPASGDGSSSSTTT